MIGMINLQKVQYEDIKNMVEATTKFEGIPDVLEEQANNIDELKSKVEDIHTHVVVQRVWQRDSDKEISILPVIKDNQETLMIHLTELINHLAGNNSEKGEENKGEGFAKKSLRQQINLSSLKDWFDSSKTMVQDPYISRLCSTFPREVC